MTIVDVFVALLIVCKEAGVPTAAGASVATADPGSPNGSSRAGRLARVVNVAVSSALTIPVPAGNHKRSPVYW